MKKVSKTITLVFAITLLSTSAAYNQADSNNKEKPELRSNANPNHGKKEQYDQSIHRDSTRKHFGGKQNFRNSGNDARRHFDIDRGHDPRMNGQGFYGHQHGQRSLRQQFYGPRHFNLRGDHFQRQSFKNERHQRLDRRDLKNRLQIQSEIKGLKEKIWKDGVMDLKERDLLRDMKRDLFNPKPARIQNNRGHQPNLKAPDNRE